MADQNAIFRNALHGFNRDDVVAYIDRMTRIHAGDMQELEKKNQKLKEQLEEAQKEAEEAKAAAEEARRALEEAGENPETQRALTDAQTLIADLRGRNGELENRICGLEEELEQLKAEREAETVPMTIPQELETPIPPVAEILPPEVEPAKDYTELELAAYRRAELTERLARERADEVYRQIQNVFSQATGKMDTGRADLEELSKMLNENFSAVNALLTNIRSAYGQAEASFAEISDRNRQFLNGED